MKHKLSLRMYIHTVDMPYMVKWLSDPDYYQAFRARKTFPSERQLIDPSLEDYFIMMIVLDEGTEHCKIIGYCAAFEFNHRNGTVHVGIVIDKEHQKHNHAEASSRLFLKYLFRNLSIRKVITEIIDDKIISLVERLGFKIEGVHVKEYCIQGVTYDERRYALFSKEFKD